MVRGLKALHDLQICHRDIKCANVFLTAEGVVKLGDLNVSKVAKGGMLRTQTGTPYYACPEVWKDMPYDNKSDIWSLGCVLYEMCTKQPPFRAENMKDIIAKCLKTRSSERISCAQLLAIPGLLNHITGTLESYEVQKDDEKGMLMKTIRMPRHMGEITERLPGQQYDS